MTTNRAEFTEKSPEKRTHTLVKVITQANLSKNRLRHKKGAEYKEKREIMATALVDSSSRMEGLKNAKSHYKAIHSTDKHEKNYM